MSEKAYDLSQFMLEKKELDTTALVMAPMPGVLKSVSVAVGDMVTVADSNFDVSGNLSFASPLMDLSINGEQRLLQIQQRHGGGKYQVRFFGTVVRFPSVLH
ncbi:propionyl-coa carboxylase alpha chain, mitochondrial [Plakobranchus ocellatus]|uniref:Propionyl-coa carboxylase alpha chain, mitochondrial n=1 Tax=Plakobranchus ocellatus TaxID=259542 RepID=A0AAV4CIC6_9GAST|nr:propionyl-coa carboxylase alpha chain, mitochondrial [Plakobranchus ocellatus]